MLQWRILMELSNNISTYKRKNKNLQVERAVCTETRGSIIFVAIALSTLTEISWRHSVHPFLY